MKMQTKKWNIISIKCTFTTLLLSFLYCSHMEMAEAVTNVYIQNNTPYQLTLNTDVTCLKDKTGKKDFSDELLSQRPLPDKEQKTTLPAWKNLTKIYGINRFKIEHRYTACVVTLNVDGLGGEVLTFKQKIRPTLFSSNISSRIIHKNPKKHTTKRQAWNTSREVDSLSVTINGKRYVIQSKFDKDFLHIHDSLVYAITSITDQTNLSDKQGPTSDPNEISILTYNLFMVDFPPTKVGSIIENVLGTPIFNYASKKSYTNRIKLMAPFMQNKSDVIILEEIYDNQSRKQLLEQLKINYPYQSTLQDRKFHPLNGGVIILSKYPIVKDVVKPFPLCLYSLEGICGRGISYVKINKNGRPYHIFGLHPQWTIPFSFRRKEFQMVQDFIKELKIPKDEAVIIGGDMNTPEGDQEMYQAMTSDLNVVAPKYVGHANTVDCETNSMFFDYSKRIDYVFPEKDHLLPVSSINETMQFKAYKQKEAFGVWDPSDHHGLLFWAKYPRKYPRNKKKPVENEPRP